MNSDEAVRWILRRSAMRRVIFVKTRKREEGPPRGRCAPLRTDLEAGRRPAGAWLQGVVPQLTGPDPHGLLDREDPELAVADLPGAGGVDDGRGDLLRVRIGDEHLDAGLREEVHGVLPAPVDLGVATLAAVPARLLHRDAGDVE